MSIPIEDVRPGWYFVKFKMANGVRSMLVVEVCGAAPFLKINTTYTQEYYDFIQRIEPPELEDQ